MALVGTFFFFLVDAYLRESLCSQASENGQMVNAWCGSGFFHWSE